MPLTVNPRSYDSEQPAFLQRPPGVRVGHGRHDGQPIVEVVGYRPQVQTVERLPGDVHHAGSLGVCTVAGECRVQRREAAAGGLLTVKSRA